MQTAGILYYAIAIAMAVHALRGGYGFIWVFVIFFIPPFGCILYGIMVLLPEIARSRAAGQGVKAVRKALDPGKQLRELKQALEMSDTVGNREALAREYARQGMNQDSIALYESSLTGMYRTDPELLTGLANALVQAGNFGRAREVLETLYAENPGADDSETRLLYARSLEAAGDTARALDVYAEAVRSFSGAEAKYRYASLLKREGRIAEAQPLFEEILRDARAGSRHSNELNRQWLDLAKKELG